MKTLIVYKDFIVREFNMIDETSLVDSIGILTQESAGSYYPNYIKESQRGKLAQLHKWLIKEGLIPLNEFFTLHQIYESQYSEAKICYYKQINFTVRDRFGRIIKIPFKISPDIETTYIRLQEQILKLIEELADSESVNMYKLKKEMLSLEREILLKENKNRNLEDEIKVLKDQIGSNK